MQVRTFDGPGVHGMPRSWLRVWLAALVVLVTAAAMVAVAPRPAAAATEDNVPYLLPNGETEHMDGVTVLTAGPVGTLTDGWYLVRGTFTSDTITVSGTDVHLILENDSDLTVTASGFSSAGIRVGGSNSLEIYAQPPNGGATGRLSATGGSGAGIGGNAFEAGGTITINGGEITASGRHGAGIGGGDSAAGGSTTINGGTVTATSNCCAAGIGGGYQRAGGSITINGGTVTARGAFGGAGIGGATGGAGGDITITGGTVSAEGGSSGGAGIGSGSGGAGGTIDIEGGDVTATGASGGAGVGGGRDGASGDITITGGATVKATGGAGSFSGGGAGIGSGGSSGSTVDGVGTITIEAGAKVTPTGGAGGSGYGAGASIGEGGFRGGEGKEVPPKGTAVFHTVTITQSRGGTVSAFPSGATGSVQVPEGGNQTFLIVPRPGFVVTSVLVDGRNVGAVDQYTIKDITANHTITATFHGPGGLVTVPPARILDTRRGLGASGPVGANQTIHLPVLGHGGVPASGVKAVVLNVTATAPTATSFVTVWAGGTQRPATSNLNFTAGQTVPNLVIAPVGKDGTVDLYNRAGTVQLVADVSGWFAAGSPGPGGLGTLAPDRLMDTRTGQGATGPVGPGQTVHLKVLGEDGVPASNVGAVVLNVTVTQPTAAHSFVTVWPDGRPRPGTSSLNFTAGQTRANLVIVPVGADGVVNFFNSAGTVQIVADVSGWFAAGAPPADSGGLGPLEPTRILDTRIPGVGGFIGPVGPGETVKLDVLGHAGIPSSGVQAVVLNVTATETTATGFVTVWADGEGRPSTSNLNFTAGQTVANAVIAPVGADGKVDFYNSNGNTQLVADVSGWFANGPPNP